MALYPEPCKSNGAHPYNPKTTTFYVRALCLSNDLDFSAINIDYSLSKDIIALVVVICDLGIGYSFFLAMILLQMF